MLNLVRALLLSSLNSLTLASLPLKHVIKYCEKVYERNETNLFWSFKNSGEVLNELKSKSFLTSSVSTYDFSTF